MFNFERFPWLVMYPNAFFGDCRAPWINDITLGGAVVPLFNGNGTRLLLKKFNIKTSF